ncbi:MAG: sensor histidine kinase [Terriglobales bacterium]
MPRPLQHETKTRVSRRFLAIYLALVALPTALFLYLGLHSLQRQAVALVQLRTGNGSGAQQLVEQIESRTSEIAENCLLAQLPLQKQLLTLSARPRPDLNEAAEFRNLVQPLLKEYPIAAQPFLIRNGKLQFPLVTAPRSRRLADYAGRDRISHQYQQLFQQAQTHQARQQWQRALDSYRQADSLPVSTELHALALVQVAAVASEAKRFEEASASWRELEKRYGDVYDPSYTPYAIRAAFGLQDAHDPTAKDALQRVRSDLLAGRWELSTEQLDKLAAELGKRLGTDIELSAFVARRHEIRALQAALQKRRPGDVLKRISGTERAQNPTVGDVFAFAFDGSGDSGGTQSFYMVLSAERGQQVLLGFLVDMDWMQKEFLPALGQNSSFMLNRKGEKGGRAEFRSLFPSWELVATPPAVQRSATVMDVFTLLGCVVLVIVVVSGFVVVYRQMANERQISQLRIDFVNGVSHELKTPITLIRVYSELLQQDFNLSEASRQNCANIVHEAERLTGLVDHILDFTRVDRGVRQYELQVGDLSAVVEHTVQSCRDYLAMREFVIGGIIRHDLPPVVFDASAVASLVLNLVDNAVKYSGSSKIVTVNLYAENGRAILEVQDYGIGIPPEEREKIFQPYYRVHSDTPRGGCGLGLSLVKQIMEAHHGKIEVASEVGHGTRFRLIFPNAATHDRAPKPAQAVAAGAHVAS